ncbi:nucleotidyltransferase family protein [Sulfuracidifex metallicus]|uniref:nucleotidyltransferase family protein n=1 Tax=Sulfuracidifex metallicus TaxID=47303 RepID=UPI002273636B|nr:nucleotidyltransferase family protein [Sulfuracidifex metallicus]MCY0850437.1 nucleotidyltransferase family protein [Sulfuracidifex metallicus]
MENKHMVDVGAVILAAGEGKRFGGNKLLFKLNGEPIIKKVISVINIDRVIIAGKYADELIPFLKEEVVIYNPKWYEGMSTSIKLGVRFMKEHEFILIVLGDMPFLSQEDVKRIIDNAEGEVVVPVHGGRRGNPVLFRTSVMLRFLDKITGDQGMRNLISKMKIKEVECSEGILRDIDRKEDLS